MKIKYKKYIQNGSALRNTTACHRWHPLSVLSKPETLFSLSFDESFNKVIQEEQMDLLVRYWDDEVKEVVTRYFGSEFLGHTHAGDRRDKFLKGLTPLYKANMVQASMGGPHKLEVLWRACEVAWWTGSRYSLATKPGFLQPTCHTWSFQNRSTKKQVGTLIASSDLFIICFMMLQLELKILLILLAAHNFSQVLFNKMAGGCPCGRKSHNDMAKHCQVCQWAIKRSQR